MNPYVLAAAMVAGISFYGGWSVNDWRHDADQKQAIEIAASDQRQLHALEQIRSGKTLDAQVAARKSEARLRSDAAASQSSFDRLQDSTSRALRAASTSIEACLAVSATNSELLLDSAARYRDLATKADQHLIDLRVQINTP